MQNSIKEIVLVLEDENEVITEDSTLVVSVNGISNGQTFMDLCLGEYSQGFSLMQWDTCISGCFLFQPEVRDGELYIEGLKVQAYCRETKTKHRIKAISKPLMPARLEADGEAYDAAMDRMQKFYNFIEVLKNPKPEPEPEQEPTPKYQTDIFLKDAKEYIHAGYELFQFEKQGRKILFLFLNGLKTKYKELVRSKEIMAELFEDGNYEEWTKSEAFVSENTIEYHFRKGNEEISFTINAKDMEVEL